MSGLRFTAPGTLAAILVMLVVAVSVPARSAEAPACTLDRATGSTIDRKPVILHGYGVRWNAATDRLAFMQPTPGGHDRVFTGRPDGNDAAPLFSDPRDQPPGHAGAPYWHPSGRLLLFVAQKAAWTGRSLFGIPDYEALPGFGRHDDLWVATADGRRAWKLTDEANTPDEGVLIPVFDPKGKRVAWSSRQPGGTYVLKIADFVETPEPHLAAVTSYQPGGPAYYETGSFSSDGERLFYASDQDTHSFWRSQIFSLDLRTGRSTRLTDGDYNEHPTVVPTPGGDWVVYMSTRGVDRFRWHLLLGTDWYAMRPDGTGAKRLGTMNLARPNNPENNGTMQVAGTVAPSPAGTFMLGDVQDSVLKQTGSVRLVRFTCPP